MGGKETLNRIVSAVVFLHYASLKRLQANTVQYLGLSLSAGKLLQHFLKAVCEVHYAIYKNIDAVGRFYFNNKEAAKYWAQ